uniref:Putative Serine-threonine protein kinase, plant-type n=1 Tax=Davidia involucrata TaxID=16924 RepID=A0A5B7BLY8_DAVIN
MGGNRIYGGIPASIGHLSGLALLNMSYNLISAEIPPELGQLEELQVLNLAGNHLSGKIPNSLGNLHKLTQIDLSGNNLLGSIPTIVEKFQNLLSMDLSNNKLNGSIPKEIFNLPSLSTYLSLSKNLLSGPLPQEVGILENVVTIDLSGNHLSGNIPNSIGNCKSLEELLMAKNMFSGNIPSTLGAVKALEILDLSSNKFSGPIPAVLQGLQTLELLNLSFNDLEGEVPSGGVFKNLSRVYLEGNPKLCLHLACDHRTRSHRRRLILVRIIIAIATISALCFVIGLLLYIRKSKAKIMPTSDFFKGQHQVVSYDELRLATGNFNQENMIGQGSFGLVYKGHLREGIAIAVKVLDIERTGSWNSFFAECMALRNVRHRNLVKLITSCSSIDFRNMEFLALVYEFMSNGSLEDWITGKRRHANGEQWNVVGRLNVAIDIACAMDYLHHECEAPVVHCDLKPSNVLLDENMTAKVGDFGLARLLIKRTGDQHSISSTNNLKGSIGYIPPG